MARHAIHASETLELGIRTVDGIMAHRLRTASAMTEVASRLLSFNMLRSQHACSASNRARFQNEIQLAFNAVAQHDAWVSVEIGHAAQADGAAMKRSAFVTLTFLPGMFVSAILNMSFFDFDAERVCGASPGDFWKYRAVVLPVTAVTAIVWAVFSRMFRPMPIGKGFKAEDDAGEGRVEEDVAEEGE